MIRVALALISALLMGMQMRECNALLTVYWMLVCVYWTLNTIDWRKKSHD